MYGMSENDIRSLIRREVRNIVDPMFMNLTNKMTGTTVISNGGGVTIREELIPGDYVDDAELSEALEPVRSRTFSVGSGGVTAGRLVYFDGTVVRNADSATSSHGGKIVGIAETTQASGENVLVYTSGLIELAALSISGTLPAPVMCGLSGQVVSSVDSGSTFVQHVGVALSSTQIYLNINSRHILL